MGQAAATDLPARWAGSALLPSQPSPPPPLPWRWDIGGPQSGPQASDSPRVQGCPRPGHRDGTGGPSAWSLGLQHLINAGSCLAKGGICLSNRSLREYRSSGVIPGQGCGDRRASSISHHVLVAPSGLGLWGEMCLPRVGTFPECHLVSTRSSQQLTAQAATGHRGPFVGNGRGTQA